MKKNYRFIDLCLLLGILLFLSFPLLQSTLHLRKWIRPLNGAFTAKPDTAFGWKGWFNESYQVKKSDFLDQNFGFRNYYVRLNNQIDFTLFRKINADQVVLGKAGVFFEESYIRAYLGENFKGERSLEQLADKLKKAQDILRSNGIQLEIVFAPGKASFFPEYIPDLYGIKKRKSNYEVLSALATKKELDVIDFNKWFCQSRSRSVYDLYPSGGIHWSNFGSLIAFDSLRKHIESRTSLTLRELKITKVRFSEELVDPDNDIADALNLIRGVKPLAMPYAEYQWLKEPGETRPQALFVGDSYFWNWYYSGLVNNTFANAQFWYYNQTAYPDTLRQREVKDLPFKDMILQNQVVVLIATENNIHDIGWGFADKVLSSFQMNEQKNSQNTAELQWRKGVYVRYLVNEMRNTPQWLSQIVAKSKEKQVALDEMLRLDAVYLYDTKYSSDEVIRFTNETKDRIRKDEKWMVQIRLKAKEKNVSTEEMLELDAKYIYDMESGKK